MSDSVHGVPPKGNGGMIALGVVMLLAAGGLVVWKMQSKPDAPEVVEEVKVEKKEEEKAAPILDNAPPPPPTEEEVEEEEKQEEKKVATGGGSKAPSGPPGCNKKCTGTASGALQAALGSRAGMSRSCYNTALRRNPNLQGKMTVRVKVSPTGAVCSAYVTNNTLGDPSVASCVTAKFRASKFPAPSGGCAEANVPLNFTRK